jgi:hypothetical protein
MQRSVFRKATDFVAKSPLCSSLALNSGVVIFGSLASLWLLPSHPAIGQNRTFHGVQVSQKFDQNSEMAKLIKQSTTKQFKTSAGVTVRLGQWVIIPGSKDSYYTYETKEIPKLESKTYSIIFLADTTSDNPKLFDYGVLCDKNQLKPVGYRSFSSRGVRVTREVVNEPWVAPTNNFLQGLANEVCRLRG